MPAFLQFLRFTRAAGRHCGGCWLRSGAVALLCLGVVPGTSLTEATAANTPVARPVTEYEVKANYLIRFLDYVAWPESTFADTSSPIIIGVVGRSQFGKSLDAAAQNRVVQKRPVVIRYGRTIREIGPCHLLFATAAETDRYADIAQACATQPVLLVADRSGGLKAGYALEFRMVENTVRFAVNLPAARHRKIELSARLLSSAVEVVQEPVPQAQLNSPHTLLTLSR